MGRKVPIGEAKGLETGANHAEMAGFLASDANPVRDERRRVETVGLDLGGKARSHVKGEVDGVELDMGDRVEEGGLALGRTEPAPRHIARRDEIGF